MEKINEILSQEYSVRKEVLLKRIDLTVQSFMWSDQAKVRIFSSYLIIFYAFIASVFDILMRHIFVVEYIKMQS